MCMYTSIYALMYVYKYVHTLVHIYFIYKMYTNVHIHKCIYVCIHIYIYIYVFIHTHIYMYTGGRPDILPGQVQSNGKGSEVHLHSLAPDHTRQGVLGADHPPAGTDRQRKRHLCLLRIKQPLCGAGGHTF
jgi:hypothetical protein